MDERRERDTLGEVRLPADALYGAQTQRAIDNFGIAGRRMPGAFVSALVEIKKAAAQVNASAGRLDGMRADGICRAADAILEGQHHDQFIIDVYQTGSGTSSNMNANEVLARLAERIVSRPVHPNDHVNMGQSSNDVVPTAIHLSLCRTARAELRPAMQHLATVLRRRATAFEGITKSGRTHLMDAMPIRLDQEFGAWAEQVENATSGIHETLEALYRLPIGGTAVGTGVNTAENFGSAVAEQLGQSSGLPFSSTAGFRNLASMDAAVAFSGRLAVAATVLCKIANDLRWMNSGPHAGLGEIALPALQPGSSIMPGKVNPVIPEAVAMACVQVSALHVAVLHAGQSGNFQLNVMLPLIVDNLLQSIGMLTRASRDLADKALAGLQVNRQHLEDTLARSPVLVTALAPTIGYDKAAEIAKIAEQEDRPVIDVAEESLSIPRERLRRLLDPRKLTEPGVPGDADA